MTGPPGRVQGADQGPTASVRRSAAGPRECHPRIGAAARDRRCRNRARSQKAKSEKTWEEITSVLIVVLAHCTRAVRYGLAAALRMADLLAPRNRWERYPEQPPPSWFKQPPF